jgi:hypothetical protein
LLGSESRLLFALRNRCGGSCHRTEVSCSCRLTTSTGTTRWNAGR